MSRVAAETGHKLRVNVRRKGRTFEADAECRIDAGSTVVWDTITDYAALPTYMPGIRACRVVERVREGCDGERLLVEQQGACGRALDQFSFPSGHALHASAFSVMLIYYFPVSVWLLLPTVALIGLSRVALGLHYPSDVAAGTTLGKAIGAIVIASAAFQKDAEGARQEIESVLTKK